MKIKFRAWDKENKKMFSSNDFGIGFSGEFWDVHDEYDKFYLDEQTGIIMQFTGLKDKNGKEIFEGDIVRIGKNKFLEFLEEGKLYVIEFCQGAFCFKEEYPTGLIFNGEDLEIIENKYLNTEVIGNIYENPEMLEDNSQ